MSIIKWVKLFIMSNQFQRSFVMFDKAPGECVHVTEFFLIFLNKDFHNIFNHVTKQNTPYEL